MEKRELICIGCPMGCPLTVTLDGGAVVTVQGNTCPRGAVDAVKKGFIAHVDVPADVRRAFAQLQTVCGKETRAANPAFATQKTE